MKQKVKFHQFLFKCFKRHYKESFDIKGTEIIILVQSNYFTIRVTKVKKEIGSSYFLDMYFINANKLVLHIFRIITYKPEKNILLILDIVIRRTY